MPVYGFTAKGDGDMEQNRVTPLTTAGCFAAVMFILALLSTYMPFFSFIGYFIMPIPMTIIYMKYGLRHAVLLGLVVGVLMGIFIDPLTAVAQLITFGAVGLSIGAGFRYAWTPAKMLACVAASLIGASAVLFAMIYAVLGVDLIGALSSAFDTMVRETLAGYESSGMTDIELAEARMQLEEVRQLLPTMLPMFLCLAMAVIAYINVKISQLVLIRLGFSVKPFLPIRYWEISRSMIYLYVLALVMKYWGTTRDIDWLTIIGININQVAFFFICIQGLACLFFFLDRRFHISTGLQALVVILFFVMPVFSYLAFAVGLMDMLLNYRRKHGMM